MNRSKKAYEVVVLEPPLAGQYETTVAQDGSWREEDAYLIKRQAAYAEAIADILGNGSFFGRTVSSERDLEILLKDVSAGKQLFILPHTTLCGDWVEALQLREDNFYGGCVRYPYQSSKMIMRPLVGGHAARPQGWDNEFANAVAGLGIPGYAVFDWPDLREATERILDGHGRARVKLATGAGGLGQFVITSMEELPKIENCMREEGLICYGLCVEADLSKSKTYVILSERVGDLAMSAVGQQRRDFSILGREIGLGGDDEIVRGEFTNLDVSRTRLKDRPELPEIIQIAGRFQDALKQHLGDIFITRNHKQIINGVDARGVQLSGTLEHSWRRGAMTGNTLLAAKAFRSEPDLVQVSTHSEYLTKNPVKDGAWMICRHGESCTTSLITRKHYITD